MAYDEELAQKVREILEESVEVSERKMFGGIAFMVSGNMCCGVVKDDLMLRLGTEASLRRHLRSALDFVQTLPPK